MPMRYVLPVVVGVCSPVAFAQVESFTPGHIFVSEFGLEGCNYPGEHRNWIREIDPISGESWRFAGPEDGLCDNTGLLFTPDRTRLRVANWSGFTVMDFAADGRGVVVYDYGDGLRFPGTGNGMAFDAQGNFYVSGDVILKFPPDGGPASTFASISTGGLAFDRTGDLYAARRGDVVRIRPDGRLEVFDTYGDGARPVTLAFDRDGNLFVGVLWRGPNEEIYRYDGGKVERKRLLAAGFDSNLFVLTPSPDQSELYVVDYHAVYAVGANNGEIRTIYEFERTPSYIYGGDGVAVFVPALPGDINCDQWVNALDIEPFILALFDPDEYEARWPHCDLMRADLNGDGSVNAFDIEPLLNLLFGP